MYCYHKVRGIVIIGWVYCYHNPFPLITHPGEAVPWAGSVTTCTDHMTRPHPHKIKGKRVISKSTYCLYGNNATFIFEAGINCVNFSMILLSDHVVWWQTFEEEQVQPMIHQEGKRC